MRWLTRWDGELTVYLILFGFETTRMNVCLFVCFNKIFLNNRSDFGPGLLLIWASVSLSVHWGSQMYCVSLAFLGFSMRPWSCPRMVCSPFQWWPGTGSAQTVLERLWWHREQQTFCRGVRPCYCPHIWEFTLLTSCPVVTWFSQSERL